MAATRLSLTMKDTIATLQMFTQIVGKIRLVNSPWVNHSWHVTLYVVPQGLTTGSIPYQRGIFELLFNFHDHQLVINTSEGTKASIDLYDRSVASFYNEVFGKLSELGITTSIYAKPNEVDPAIPFAEDETHHNYNKQQATAYFKALVQIHNVFNSFRAKFSGKCSPVHFFWGAFDLAVTRFSGREAPKHPGGAPNMPAEVMQEAYSHEVSSAGFWPGSEAFPQACFYSYCYPTPENFGKEPVMPEEAFYSNDMGEFFLPYKVVAESPNPAETLLQFLQTTYEAAAKTLSWNRTALEFDGVGG